MLCATLPSGWDLRVVPGVPCEKSSVRRYHAHCCHHGKGVSVRLIRLNLQFACVSIFVYVLFEHVFWCSPFLGGIVFAASFCVAAARLI